MNEKVKNKKIRICFVSLNSYLLLKENNQGYVGGAEVQQVELAKELKNRGYDVSFVTYGQNTRHETVDNGIEIYPAYDRNAASKLIILKKIYLIFQKMKEANADIYVYRTGSPGAIPVFGILLHKKIIKSLASDTEITGEILIHRNNLISLFEKIAVWIDIKFSDVVISQHNFQKSELKKKFKVESIVINNAFHIPPKVRINSNKDNLLWIGTIRSVKQPHLFLEIAQHFPKYKFIMIGGEGESHELFRNIRNKAETIPNLDFIGFVSHEKIFDYYMKAFLLINTSKAEGFPNVFLEAWMHSIPVVSLNVDPDGVIAEYKLGYHSKTFEQMLENIKELLNDIELLQIMGENGRKYIEEHHDVRKIADQYETLIEKLLKNI